MSAGAPVKMAASVAISRPMQTDANPLQHGRTSTDARPMQMTRQHHHQTQAPQRLQQLHRFVKTTDAQPMQPMQPRVGARTTLPQGRDNFIRAYAREAVVGATLSLRPTTPIAEGRT